MDSVSSRQFRDFSATVYCNKRLVSYKKSDNIVFFIQLLACCRLMTIAVSFCQ